MDKPKGFWFRVVVVVGIVAIIVLLALNLLANRQTPGPDTSTGPTGATSATDPTSGPLLVAAGEGGSDVAPADDTTPIGYDLTCTGAVQAATNYLVALTSWDSTNLLPAEQYDALVDDLTHGMGATLPNSGTSLKLTYADRLGDVRDFPSDVFHKTVLPATGMFRVTHCDGQTATIDIAYSGHILMPAFLQDGQPILDDTGAQVWADEWYFTSSTVNLQVADGDWALVQLEESSEMDDDPALTDVDLEYGQELTPDMRKAVLALVGPEWTEYTNAP